MMALGWCATAVSQDPKAADVEQRLREVIGQIEAIERELQAGESEKGKLTAQLAELERSIGEAGRKIHAIDGEIDTQQLELQQLREQQAQLRHQLGTQSEALANQIRSAYLLGRQHRLKLLLNLEDPSTASRTLSYYRYFNQARQSLIDGFADQLREAERISAAVSAATDRLDRTRESLRNEQQQQRQLHSNRQQLLGSVIEQLGERRDQLSQLSADQVQLSQLLERLKDIFHDIPATLDEQAPAFGTLRGKLRWPLQGRLREQPGRDKPGGLHRYGAVLTAQAGSPVKAIAHGRVAFSDWLRGFGLLIIVDHGDNYLSLYGFNEALYRDVGDWVTPGESIAAVGNSGGRPESGLYLELRRDGKAIDLRRWLTDAAH